MSRILKWAWPVLLAVAMASAQAGAYDAFFKAMEMNDGGTVTGLLQRGFDPDSRDERGQTGLYIALREGSDKAVAALLAHPQLSVDLVNSAGETALMMAALKGRTAWLAPLLARGAAVNRPGWSPLHYAASGPDSAAVTVLLSKGAVVDARSPNGSTPLMMAARYGAEASVAPLLAAGADRALRNEQGLTAADFARDGGREALSASLAAPR